MQPTPDKPLMECCPAQKTGKSYFSLAGEFQFAHFPFSSISFSSGLSRLLCLTWVAPSFRKFALETLIASLLQKSYPNYGPQDLISSCCQHQLFPHTRLVIEKAKS